ncbi:MAG: hypothetical protein RMY36_004510 [Nostoc sp. SerVER01]|nr:hypothetical protein [Nostoc sp. SerVER01]
MSVFDQQDLERCQERYQQYHDLSKELSAQIAKLASGFDYAYDEQKRIGLEKSIAEKKAQLQNYENDLKILKKQIDSLLERINSPKKNIFPEQKINNEESSDESREFSEFNQPQEKNSEHKEEEFNLASKVIQELQKQKNEKSEPSANKPKDVHAKSLIKDDEIKNTLLYTVTFFPQLSVEDFDQVVAFFLEVRTKEFISTSEIVDEQGKVQKIEKKEIKKLSELWQNFDNPTYKDELLSQCYIEPQQLPNSFQEVIDFTENYSYLRDEFIQLFKKSGFYLKDKFQKVQHLIFWRSEKVVANAILIAVNMALSDPNLYGQNFLLGIISGLGEYEEQKLLHTTLNSLASEQSFEQTIFNIKEQQRQSEGFKSLVCERLAALVYKMEENTDLKGISDNFLKQLMKPPINRYDVVLEICKYLRTTSEFNEIYWIKQILARGDAETKDKAYKFLLTLLKQGKYLIYERLKAIEEWLPNPSQNPHNYSTLNKYALQIFVEYSLEQTSNLNVESYGEYPFRHSLFYPLQYGEVEDKLDTLLNFLFCLYIDKTEKYHTEKLALSYIVDKDVNAMDLISFLIAQWYMILYGLKKDNTNPEVSKIFEQLLSKIIDKISPYLRKELIKSWIRYGKYLGNQSKISRKLQPEFLARYDLVKQLKEQFSLLEKSIA